MCGEFFFWVPCLSFEKNDYGSLFCMILDWMWLEEFYWGKSVYVTLKIEVESVEVFCTSILAMENY